MGGFIQSVICAPYSIPIGIINSKKTLGVCSETINQDLEVKDISDTNRVYSGNIGTVDEGVNTSSHYDVLVQNVNNILRKHKQTSSVNVNAHTMANINCRIGITEPIDPAYHNFLTGARTDRGVHESIDCWNKYEDTHNCRHRFTKKYKDSNGRVHKVPVYGCCPSVDQKTTIDVETYEGASYNDYQEIANEIDLYVNNTLNVQGSDEPSNTQLNVGSSNEVRNQLIVNIEEKITNATQQNLNISQSLDYTDRYGMCHQVMGQDGRVRSVGKRLKQSIDIDILSKNIINSSIKILMKNDVSVKSTTDVTLQRITNYRVIVCSLLSNVVCLYLLFKMFSIIISLL